LLVRLSHSSKSGAGAFYNPVEPFKISLLERTTRKVVTTEGQTFEAFRLALYLYSLLPTLRESLTTLPLDPAFCNRSIFVAQTRLAICESTTPDLPLQPQASRHRSSLPVLVQSRRGISTQLTASPACWQLRSEPSNRLASADSLATTSWLYHPAQPSATGLW